MDAPVAVILAAGKSTRMNSPLPKVLHPVNGRPMANFVMDAARSAGAERLILVVGHQAERVQDELGGAADVAFARQEQQLGTGHAVLMCEDHLKDHDGPVFVLAGDTPLIRASSLKTLSDELVGNEAACVIGSAETDANEGLGRIVRDASGQFQRIVEQKDASPEEQQIKEINTGCYCFQSRLLFSVLSRIQPNNTQSELYLTDAPALLLADGHSVLAASCFDENEAMGVNTQDQLADVARLLQ